MCVCVKLFTDRVLASQVYNLEKIIPFDNNILSVMIAYKQI